VGLIQTARRGSLFLDEVGDIPAPMQVKLHRFLQEGSFVPVCARTEKRAHMRVLAVTNRDLEAMAAAGQSRENLYDRLEGSLIRTPPLAERSEDVLLLATGFLRAASRKLRFGVANPTLPTIIMRRMTGWRSPLAK
jgi:two-component system NtrC family response regulator